MKRDHTQENKNSSEEVEEIPLTTETVEALIKLCDLLAQIPLDTDRESGVKPPERNAP